MYKFSKTKRIAIASISFLIFLAVILGPALSRCFIYYKEIASNTLRISYAGSNEVFEVSTVTTLAHEPEIIDLPQFDLNTNFSLGYAQCYIDPNLINTIEFRFEIAVSVNSPESEKLFFGFFNPLEEDISFEDELKAMRTYPKSYFQICCMTKDEFSEYLAWCFLKTSGKFNENGFGIFENDNIKGFIRFGTAYNPAHMYVDIYSKKYSINQGITVISSSPEKTRMIILSLLSSYRYLADRPLEETALKQMVSNALSQHPKFQPDTPDEVKLPRQ